MAKRFTLDEAERLLPEIDETLRALVSLKGEFDEAEESIHSVTQRVIMQGGLLIDRSAVYRNKLRRDNSAEQMRAKIEKIQEAGVLLKDLDLGLVDFPTLFRGEEVYLCWKRGEPGIGFWHGIHEGFAGRKAIDQDFRENHRGDPAN